ncbi:MAG: hypothetical protein JO244_07065 [Solirubrobacterales bacterium]|nr:hypothetical protein [Solirubrobacterales bacterium]
MVIGPRDDRPTSTRLLLTMARTPVAILPSGGIPVVDAQVAARAHLKALDCAEGGRRYVVAGPYLSYPRLAALVAGIAGRPRLIVVLPETCQRPLAWAAGRWPRWCLGSSVEISSALVASGFLRLHVSGARADAAFGLHHPPPAQSIFEALDDHRRHGRAHWLKRLQPVNPLLSPAPIEG